MKKIFFITIIVCCAHFVNAQLSGGLKGGLNLTNQKWDVSITGFGSNSEKFDGTSFHIGGYLNYAITETVSIQPELLYNQLSVDQEDETLKFNYLSLPVMLGYGFDANKFVLQAGPQIGFLLSTDPSEMKEDKYMKAIDFSFGFGATANFGKFNIAFRYALGLTNIAEDKLSRETEEELEDFFGSDVDVDIDIKNNNLQFSVGYKLFGE